MPIAPRSERLAELFNLISGALTEASVEESITMLEEEPSPSVLHHYRLTFPEGSSVDIKALEGACDYVEQILGDSAKLDSLPIGVAVLARPLSKQIRTLRSLCKGIEHSDGGAVDVDPCGSLSEAVFFAPKLEKDYRYEKHHTSLAETISNANACFGEVKEAIPLDSPGLAAQISDIQERLNEICLSEDERRDMNFTLAEIATCTQNRCYIAAIALCGRCLERALWLLLDAANVTFNRDKDGMQKLWEKLTHPKNLEKLPGRAQNVFDQAQQRELFRIVQRYRNACAHAQSDPLFPSLSYVTFVIGALGAFWENTASILNEKSSAL